MQLERAFTGLNYIVNIIFLWLMVGTKILVELFFILFMFKSFIIIFYKEEHYNRCILLC